ncbi:MAG: hypothetical protein ABJK67_09375, partial [Anderseniella sp.]
ASRRSRIVRSRVLRISVIADGLRDRLPVRQVLAAQVYDTHRKGLSDPHLTALFLARRYWKTGVSET